MQQQKQNQLNRSIRSKASQILRAWKNCQKISASVKWNKEGQGWVREFRTSSEQRLSPIKKWTLEDRDLLRDEARPYAKQLTGPWRKLHGEIPLQWTVSWERGRERMTMKSSFLGLKKQCRLPKPPEWLPGVFNFGLSSFSTKFKIFLKNPIRLFFDKLGPFFIILYILLHLFQIWRNVTHFR